MLVIILQLQQSVCNNNIIADISIKIRQIQRE